MTIQANFPAIKPSLMLDFANTKQLDSRITYTRASTASYYDGVTTSMAEQNLFLYSQDYTNANWTKQQSSTVTASQTAPDGTTTASLITNVAQFGGISQFVSGLTIGLSYTISFYAKAGTNTNLITVRNDSAGTNIGTYTPTASWALYSFTFTAVATSATLYPIQDRNASGFGTIFLWGAQLEQRSAVTAYTATTTQAITNYIPKLQSAASGVARFDNNPTTGESLGLLIEESRTNLLLYSSQFDDASWTKNASVTVTANQVVSPNGTLDADQLNIVGNGGTTQIYKSITVANATAHTMSLYVKYYSGANGDFLFSMGSDTTRGIRVTVSASLLTISEVGANVTTSGFQSVGNGWFRIYFTVTSTSTSFEYNIYRPVAYGGSGTNSFFIWGAQLEAGAFATSYIPTVASQVTRAADAASMTGTNFSSWYSINGGSLYGSYRIAFTSGSRYVLSIDQNIQNYVELAGNGSTNRTLLFNRSGNTLDVNITGTSAVSLTSLNQVAIAVANNDFALYLNGTSQGTDTSAILAPTLATLEIGRYNEGSPGGYLNGTIAKIAYYPVRVTNAQLAALTS